MKAQFLNSINATFLYQFFFCWYFCNQRNPYKRISHFQFRTQKTMAMYNSIFFLLQYVYDLFNLIETCISKPMKAIYDKICNGCIVAVDEIDLETREIRSVFKISVFDYAFNYLAYILWGTLPKPKNLLVIPDDEEDFDPSPEDDEITPLQNDKNKNKNVNKVYDIKTSDGRSFLTRRTFKIPREAHRLPLLNMSHNVPFMMVVGNDTHNLTEFANERCCTIAKGDFTARELFKIASISLSLPLSSSALNAEGNESKLEFYQDIEPIVFVGDERVKI